MITSPLAVIDLMHTWHKDRSRLFLERHPRGFALVSGYFYYAGSGRGRFNEKGEERKLMGIDRGWTQTLVGKEAGEAVLPALNEYAWLVGQGVCWGL